MVLAEISGCDNLKCMIPNDGRLTRCSMLVESFHKLITMCTVINTIVFHLNVSHDLTYFQSNMCSE